MSGPFWQPTDGQRRYYDRGAEQRGQAAQGVATWQQRARGDPAEALRQRYAELHGIGPTLHADPGQAAIGPATQDAATHQRAYVGIGYGNDETGGRTTGYGLRSG